MISPMIGRDRSHHRVRFLRQPLANQLQLLGDDLAVHVDVRPPIELHPNNREARYRRPSGRAGRRRRRSSPIRSGNVTSTSTSSGASPCASVMMVTVGRFRFGNTSDRQPGRLAATINDQDHGRGQHDQTIPQTEGDNLIQHGFFSKKVSNALSGFDRLQPGRCGGARRARCSAEGRPRPGRTSPP